MPPVACARSLIEIVCPSRILWNEVLHATSQSPWDTLWLVDPLSKCVAWLWSALFWWVGTRLPILRCFSPGLEAGLPRNPWIPNSTSIQGHLMVVTTLPVVGVQSLPFGKLSTSQLSPPPPLLLHQNLCFRCLYNLFPPGCIECEVLWPSSNIFFLSSATAGMHTRLWNHVVPSSWITNLGAFPTSISSLIYSS